MAASALVPEVLLGRHGDEQRGAVVGRVEVARDGDEATRIGLKQLFQQQTQLQRLGVAFQGRQQEAFRPSADRAPGKGSALLARYGARERRSQVRVDDSEARGARHLDLRQQKGAVEPHFLRLGALCDEQRPEWRHVVVQHRPLTDDGKAGQSHEIMDVDNVSPAGRGDCARVVLVACAREHPIERYELALLLPRDPLSVHLLQAHDVGGEPLEHRPQHRHSGLEIDMRLRAHVETFDVEGRNSHEWP